MFPEIIILDRHISMYAVMSLIGIFTMAIYIISKARKQKIDENDFLITMLFAAIGVVVGSHILYGITNFDKIIIVFNNLEKLTSFEEFINVFGIIFGGSVFYGGLIGGIIAGYIYLKKTKKDIGAFISIITPGIPLFHCFGRIGCFLGGCCYGIESSFGFTYTHSLNIVADGVNRFPVQLLEAALNLCLFFVLAKLSKNKKFDEYLIFIYLITYSIIRFSDEFLRGDEIRGFIFGISTSQFISLIIFIISTIIVYFKLKRTRKIIN